MLISPAEASYSHEVFGSFIRTNRVLMCVRAFLIFLLFTSSAVAQFKPDIEDSLTVNDVSISGNESFSSSTISDLVLTRESPWGFFVFLHDNIWEFIGKKRVYFEYATAAEDVKAIKDFYQQNGYFSAEVENQLQLTDDSTGVNVRFVITEGDPSYIDSINYRNTADLPDSLITRIYASPVIKTGQRYQAEKLAAEQGRILSLLHNNGFPRAAFDSIVVERFLSTNNVTIKLTLKHGRRLYFGSIRDSVRDNKELNLARRVIYDRMDFKSGDVYSQKKRDEAESAILRYGVFRLAQLRADVPPIENTSDSLVPLTVILDPGDMRYMDIGPIVQFKDYRLYLGAAPSILWKNVFGGAQKMTVKTSYVGNIIDFDQELPFLGAQQFTGYVKYEQPYFGDNRTSMSGTVSYTYVDEANLYTGNLLGITPAIHRRLSDYINWTTELGYELLYYNIDVDSDSIATSDLPTALTGLSSFGTERNYMNMILSSYLDFNYTNDYFNPTSGFMFRLTLEEAGFFGGFPSIISQKYSSTEYHKAEVNFRKFNDLSKNKSLIFAYKLKAGAIFQYGGSDAAPVPFSRRYYGGGPSSVRGWSPRRLVVNKENDNIGSNALVEATAELRWQLFPYTDNILSDIRMTFFTDVGNVWDKVEQITVPQFGWAAGMGVGFLTTLGVIRVEYGYRLYDPGAMEGEQWYNERKFALAHGAIQIGIGWSF